MVGEMRFCLSPRIVGCGWLLGGWGNALILEPADHRLSVVVFVCGRHADAGAGGSSGQAGWPWMDGGNALMLEPADRGLRVAVGKQGGEMR